MGSYVALCDAGVGILALLREKLVPEVVESAEKIGFCVPEDFKKCDVGIGLYDMVIDKKSESSSATSVTAYYVISVTSKNSYHEGNEARDESKILGRIIQVINDYPVIPEKYMPTTASRYAPAPVSVKILPLELDEKLKILMGFDMPRKALIFLAIGPLEIDSEKKEIEARKHRRVEKVYLGSSAISREKMMADFSSRIKDEDIDDEWTQKPEDEEDCDDENEDE